MAFISNIFVILAVATVTFATPTLRYKREGQAASSSASSPLDSFTQNIPSGLSGANSPVNYEQYIQQLSSLSGQFPTGSLPAVGSLPTFGQSSTRRKREESAAAASNPLQGFTQNIPSQFSGANSPVPYEQYIQQLSSLSGQFPTGSLPAVGSLPIFGQSSTRRKREESAAAASNPLQGFTQNIPSQFSGANSPVPYEQYIQQLSSLSGQFPTGSLPAVGSLPTFGQSSTRKGKDDSAAASPSSNPFAELFTPEQIEQYMNSFQQFSGSFPTGSLPAANFPSFGSASTSS